MEFTAKELEFQNNILSYEVDSKISIISKFDENWNSTDWLDLIDVTTDEILNRHKIDSSQNEQYFFK